jgi:hypothetical protein
MPQGLQVKPATSAMADVVVTGDSDPENVSGDPSLLRGVTLE